MADLSITAASVAPSTGSQTETGTAGTTITAGQTVYLDSTDSKLKLADSNASAATASVKGIALHGSLNGQPLTYQRGGDITIGATIEAGKVYVQSATAGAIAPVADLATGHKTTIIGFGISTTVMRMALNNTGITV